jgi:hypothetical protein
VLLRVSARTLLALVLVLTGAASLLAGPAEAVAAAYADAARLPPETARTTRYLSTYAIPEKERPDFLRALKFHCNSLSREAELVPPRQVAPELLAVNLLDYGWKAKTYEKLLDGENGQPEPYFHAPVKVSLAAGDTETWPGGVDSSDGRFYPAGRYTVKHKKSVIQQAQAPWLDPAHTSALVSLTQSQVPVLRADWFLFQTAIQAGRDGHGYYDFLGLGKEEKDFQALIGADPVLARKVKKEIAGVVARSGVTLNNRRLVRLGAITGGYWFSEDFKTSTAKQNVLRLLDEETDPPKGDASEQYGFLPNGLFAFWLQNAQGVRQDSAPDFIASDRLTGDNDGRVHIGLSCIRCHQEGIRPIDDYARKLYRGSVVLQSPDYRKFVRLRQLYLSDLAGHVRQDQEQYATALLRVNGLTAAANARAYAGAWDSYLNGEVTVAVAARELGCTEAHLLLALKASAKTTGQLDPVLAGLIQEPPLPLRREHMEELYATLQTILRGYIVPVEAKAKVYP